MKIVDDKIVEATEAELFSFWLKMEYDDVMSFQQFLKHMIRNRVIIVKDYEVMDNESN